MSGSFLGFVFELLVSGLLVTTIVYCLVVNRKLDKLRSEQSSLKDVVNDLQVATQHAETAIVSLRATVDTAQNDLESRINSAQDIGEMLQSTIEKAQKMSGGQSRPLPAAAPQARNNPQAISKVRAKLSPDMRLSNLTSEKPAPQAFNKSPTQQREKG